MNAKECSALGAKNFKVMVVKEKYIQTVLKDRYSHYNTAKKYTPWNCDTVFLN